MLLSQFSLSSMNRRRESAAPHAILQRRTIFFGFGEPLARNVS
jgi:hypothetical protein